MLEQLSAGDRRKLIGILGRLGSDHAGERAAAALLASRLVAGKGLTWADLLDLTPVKPRLTQPAPAADEPWRDGVESCLQYPGLLTVWERRFLRDLLCRRSLTAAQQDKVRQIAQQLRERCAA